MKISVCKEFKFSYGHFLPGHETCGEQHGHNARMLVTISGKLDQFEGMIIDFHEMKTLIDKGFVSKIDHKNLNKLPYFDVVPPTVENLCVIAFQLIDKNIGLWNAKHEIKSSIELEEVIIYETDGAFAKVTR